MYTPSVFFHILESINYFVPFLFEYEYRTSFSRERMRMYNQGIKNFVCSNEKKKSFSIEN